jgi:hypothetical protein
MFPFQAQGLWQEFGSLYRRIVKPFWTEGMRVLDGDF